MVVGLARRYSSCLFWHGRFGLSRRSRQLSCARSWITGDVLLADAARLDFLCKHDVVKEAIPVMLPVMGGFDYLYNHAYLALLAYSPDIVFLSIGFFSKAKMHFTYFRIWLAAACFLLTPLTTAYPNHASTHDSRSHINYTTVTGYFLQDEASTNPTTFDFTKENFGLINRTYPSDHSFKSKHGNTQWRRFAHQVAELNKAAPWNVEYKVLFMGRHGDGYHNDAQAYYGTPAWNCYYSEIDGNSTVTWADADLSPLGVTQALAVNTFWKLEIAEQHIPTPQSYYTSPLTRCLKTANYTFNGLDLPAKHPFVPTVKELFREGISGHTCDRRNTSTYIHNLFPHYKIEAGFAENDPLWEALHGETRVDQNYRSKIVLDKVFESDESTYISITSHSGEIASILQVLGHQPFSLNTGAVIPVLVKAELDRGAAPSIALQNFTPLCTCTSPPDMTATTSVCADPTPSNGEIPKYPSSAPR